MRYGRAVRLPALILILGCASAVLTTIVPPKVLNVAWFSLAGTILLALGFLFSQLEVFEKAGDSPDLTAAEVRQVNSVSEQRRWQIKLLLALGLAASGLAAAPWGLTEAGFEIVINPLCGLLLGCVLGFAINCVLVYFDWREDLVRMRQTAKQRAAQRAEADMALRHLSAGKPVEIGTFGGFRPH